MIPAQGSFTLLFLHHRNGLLVQPHYLLFTMLAISFAFFLVSYPLLQTDAALATVVVTVECRARKLIQGEERESVNR